MLNFESDYTLGAHPRILERLSETNMRRESGYGSDSFCLTAAEKIRKACEMPEASVHFLAGGTQTNQVVISSVLRPYEGVIAAATGHVSLHEAGAIEITGHKVIALPSHGGKLSASDVRDFIETFREDESREHTVFPGMVYISFPTEYGTLYSRAELEELYGVCGEFSIPLYIDGARLAYGLMSESCDLDLPTLASLCDVFYIGGTKVGALLGEAVVFTNMSAPEHFLTLTKQRGALLAKGRAVGLQFDVLFEDGLYFALGEHADRAAKRLREILVSHGLELFMDSPTNQQFVILTRSRMERLRDRVGFSLWEWLDPDRCVVRFASDWATSDGELDELDRILDEEK